MKLSTLIELVGDENVEFQYLHECFVSAQSTKKGVQVTFGTAAISQAEMLSRELEKVCLIVWIPKDRFVKAMEP